jgi:hypothetical protein
VWQGSDCKPWLAAATKAVQGSHPQHKDRAVNKAVNKDRSKAKDEARNRARTERGLKLGEEAIL